MRRLLGLWPLLALFAALLGAVGVWAFFSMDQTPLAGSDPELSVRLEGPEPPDGWRDWPVVSGQWELSRANDRSVAHFSGGLAAVQCDKTNSHITISRRREAAGPSNLTIITSTQSRGLQGSGLGDRISTTLAGDDDLLDAIAFSRGRFVLSAEGHKPLPLPSWPEINRIIEDCR